MFHHHLLSPTSGAKPGSGRPFDFSGHVTVDGRRPALGFLNCCRGLTPRWRWRRVGWGGYLCWSPAASLFFVSSSFPAEPQGDKPLASDSGAERPGHGICNVHCVSPSGVGRGQPPAYASTRKREGRTAMWPDL